MVCLCLLRLQAIVFESRLQAVSSKYLKQNYRWWQCCKGKTYSGFCQKIKYQKDRTARKQQNWQFFQFLLYLKDFWYEANVFYCIFFIGLTPLAKDFPDSLLRRSIWWHGEQDSWLSWGCRENQTKDGASRALATQSFNGAVGDPLLGPVVCKSSN